MRDELLVLMEYDWDTQRLEYYTEGTCPLCGDTLGILAFRPRRRKNVWVRFRCGGCGAGFRVDADKLPQDAARGALLWAARELTPTQNGECPLCGANALHIDLLPDSTVKIRCANCKRSAKGRISTNPDGDHAGPVRIYIPLGDEPAPRPVKPYLLGARSGVLVWTVYRKLHQDSLVRVQQGEETCESL